MHRSAGEEQHALSSSEISKVEIDDVPDPPETDANRRSARDRRRRPTGVFDSLRGWQRRRFARRDGEAERLYVDTYQPSDLAMLLGILALNGLDAIFTLRWLEMGGGESNPVMDWLLDFGNLAFLVQKCLVVGIWLVILTMHKNFRIARIGLRSLLALYTFVLFYHFYLQSGLAAPPQ